MYARQAAAIWPELCPRPQRAEMATAELWWRKYQTGGRLAFAEVPLGGLTPTFCCDDDAGGVEIDILIYQGGFMQNSNGEST